MQNLILEVYNSIREFYPIGLDCESPLFHKSSFYKSFHKKCKDKLSSDVHLKWKNLLDSSGESRKWVDTTRSMPPSYSGYLLIKEIKCKEYRIVRTFHAELSVLGNFFSVYGKEQVFKTGGNKNSILFSPSIIVSPINDFNDEFTLLSEKIYSKFPDYKFVPFRILRAKIKGLDLESFEPKNSTNIYQAIFNRQNIFENKINGDISFSI